MTTKTECPSAAWDRHYDSQESAEAEVIHEWLVREIEHTRTSIGGGTFVHRDHFKPKDGWPEDPAEIADEITNLVCSHAVLIEVIFLLAKAQSVKP
jgi:hypothetical protein